LENPEHKAYQRLHNVEGVVPAKRERPERAERPARTERGGRKRNRADPPSHNSKRTKTYHEDVAFLEREIVDLDIPSEDQLNEEQKKAANYILEGHNVFLTGPAGVGKVGRFLLPYIF
jgi:hypothetical protein